MRADAGLSKTPVKCTFDKYRIAIRNLEASILSWIIVFIGGAHGCDITGVRIPRRDTLQAYIYFTAAKSSKQ